MAEVGDIMAFVAGINTLLTPFPACSHINQHTPAGSAGALPVRENGRIRLFHRYMQKKT
jgi:hypothetical protein